MVHPKTVITQTIDVDISKLEMPEWLILTVGVYPNGDVRTFKRNTVSAANFETHVRYNATYRPGRALFAKFPDGTVMCLLEGACSQEQLERASKEIYNMSIGTEDSAPYH